MFVEREREREREKRERGGGGGRKERQQKSSAIFWTTIQRRFNYGISGIWWSMKTNIFESKGHVR